MWGAQRILSIRQSAKEGGAYRAGREDGVPAAGRGDRGPSGLFLHEVESEDGETGVAAASCVAAASPHCRTETTPPADRSRVSREAARLFFGRPLGGGSWASAVEIEEGGGFAHLVVNPYEHFCHWGGRLGLLREWRPMWLPEGWAPSKCFSSAPERALRWIDDSGGVAPQGGGAGSSSASGQLVAHGAELFPCQMSGHF